MPRIRLGTRAVGDIRGGSDLTVVVYESQLDAMFQPGGTGVRYANTQAREVASDARSNAPVRSGELSRFIRAVPSRSTGKRSVRSSVRSGARHSLWVHEGTAGDGAGYIYPARKRAMKLPPGGPTYHGGPSTSRHMGQKFKAMRLKKVRGQKGNPFLRQALYDAVYESFIPARGVPRGRPIFTRRS